MGNRRLIITVYDDDGIDHDIKEVEFFYTSRGYLDLNSSKLIQESQAFADSINGKIRIEIVI